MRQGLCQAGPTDRFCLKDLGFKQVLLHKEGPKETVHLGQGVYQKYQNPKSGFWYAYQNPDSEFDPPRDFDTPQDFDTGTLNCVCELCQACYIVPFIKISINLDPALKLIYVKLGIW